MQPDTAALSTAELVELADRIRHRLGLGYPQARHMDLARAVQGAAVAMNHSSMREFAARLREPAASSEWEALAEQATVGETYFFREPAGFDALREHVLPPLIAERRSTGERRLRFWSAGCCTGEEPYSIAMLLEQLLPDLAQWSITILATDVNRQFLRAADRAVYRDWSFRGGQDIRRVYFQVRPDGQFELVRRIRERVTLAHLNLAEESYPSGANGTNAMDVILCRNVLMYFDPVQARATVQRLAGSLAPRGCLMVGAAEMIPDLLDGLVPRRCGGAVVFEGERTVAVSAPANGVAGHGGRAPGAVTADAGAAAAVPSNGRPSDDGAAGDGPGRPKDPVPDPRAMGQLARMHADRGELQLALEWSQRAVAADRLDPGAHYLRANIDLALGRPDAAVASLERAIFLVPDHLLAHFTLGTVERVRGRHAKARRHFDVVLRIGAGKAAPQVIADADGLTVGRLMEIVHTILAPEQLGDDRPYAFGPRTGLRERAA
jgi:chemotaxis protein methyltransferase CheR